MSVMDQHRSCAAVASFLNERRNPSRAFCFLFFAIGLSIGFTASLRLKSISFSLKATDVVSSFSSLPPPLLVLPPPPPPLQLLPLTSLSEQPPPLPLVNSSLPTEDKLLLKNTTEIGSLDDEDLFRKASMSPRMPEKVPKVAFMFLTKGPLPLGPLWDRFFRGNENLYSIYIHSDPSFPDSEPESSVFYRKRVPSKSVQWGKPTMIDAERRLLANALLDFSNERFVLLSDSCIPLFNFTMVYNYLVNAKQSFVASYDDPRKIGRGRYNHQMYPTISISEWRKGSQWFEMNRRVAVEIVSDKKYYPVFRDHCLPPCYTDEHYVPTVVNILLPEENINRSLTWVDWSKSGPHPGRFIKQDVTMEFLDRIRFGTNCRYNGENSSVCFLFARKFVRDTMKPLLDLSYL